MRYVIQKHIKATGHTIEGRGATKAIAQARFKRALAAFRKLKNSGLHEVDTFGNNGKVFTRKSLVNTVLPRQNQ